MSIPYRDADELNDLGIAGYPQDSTLCRINLVIWPHYS